MFKKRILSIVMALLVILMALPITTYAAGEVAINEVNFPDYVFRSYVVEFIDKDKNMTLSAEEIAAVQTWDYFDHDTTTTLKGIEFFTALKKLNCSKNKLTSLDLSKNTLLTELDCSNNSLVSLNVSSNAMLTKINCSYNQLTDLDLSGTPKLTSLDCINNKISDLNLNANTVLKEVYCGTNGLINLDLSANSELTLLDCTLNRLPMLNLSNNTVLETLRCGNNELDSLDLSKNKALLGLECGANLLTELDLSENKTLVSADCGANLLTHLDLSANTELESFGCYDNQITSLDFSKNVQIKYLHCDFNQLTSINLSNNTELILLNCYNNQLENLDVSNCTKLAGLYCDNNKLISLDMSNCPELYRFYCNQNQLTNLDLSANAKLMDLQCSNNFIKELNIDNCRKLEYLLCVNNQITSLNLSGFASLSILSCIDNQLTNLKLDGCKELVWIMCENNNITVLDFPRVQNFITEKIFQNAYGKTKKIFNAWTVNISSLVGAGNLSKVEIQSTNEWEYDANTGIAVYKRPSMPSQLVYYYHGDYLPATGMEVRLELEPQPHDDNGTCVVMKQDAEQAYVNGVIAPTTKYATGYAKMENINGTMQMPLRYIAEVNDLVVVYDENTQKTKVIHPVSKEYLLITPGSKTVTKHTADGTLISSSEAPLAFAAQNGVTMGPLRYTCEALGLTVSYQETSHGNYVVVSPESKTSAQAIEKIEEAYQLGLS